MEKHAEYKNHIKHKVKHERVTSPSQDLGAEFLPLGS